MLRRATLLLLAAVFLLPAQSKYKGPRPEKPDLPYLVHADNLLPTEATEAKEETRKDDILYVVKGPNSPVKTPMPSPILLMQGDKLQVDHLQLYKLDSKNGQREILFSRKKKQTAKPLLITVTRLTTDNLYRIEVVPSLEAGEYSLTPDGSNQVFCFSVY